MSEATDMTEALRPALVAAENLRAIAVAGLPVLQEAGSAFRRLSDAIGQAYAEQLAHDPRA